MEQTPFLSKGNGVEHFASVLGVRRQEPRSHSSDLVADALRALVSNSKRMGYAQGYLRTEELVICHLRHLMRRLALHLTRSHDIDKCLGPG